MPVLDSCFLIMLSHDDKQTVRALHKVNTTHLIVPAQAAAEFLVGVDEHSEELKAIHDSFDVVHTDDNHLLAMAELRSKARTRAIRPRWGDIHIAAQAKIHDTYVITNNERHFRQLGVPVWDWIKNDRPPQNP